MLVVGISSSTSLSLCFIICCVICFIHVKRNNTLAYKLKLDRTQKIVNQEIGALESSLQKIKAAPKPSSGSTEQQIGQQIGDATVNLYPPGSDLGEDGLKGSVTLWKSDSDDINRFKSFNKIYPGSVSVNGNSLFSNKAFVLYDYSRWRPGCIKTVTSSNPERYDGECLMFETMDCSKRTEGVIPSDAALFELHKIGDKIHLFQLQNIGGRPRSITNYTTKPKKQRYVRSGGMLRTTQRTRLILRDRQ
jgi:hypothetical protein